MAQQVFVQQVAFLEGLKNIAPAKETLPVTLDNIHARVAALERQMGQPQPPTVVPDWESLRYRTTRLYRGHMGGPSIYALIVLADHWWPSAEEVGEQATAQALERTLRSLGIFSYTASSFPSRADEAKKDAVDDDGNDKKPDASSNNGSSSNTDQFDIAVQEFCHLAGRKRKQPMRPLHSARELYAAAFELSLVLEGKSAFPVQYPPPPGYFPSTLPGSGLGGMPMGQRPPGSMSTPSHGHGPPPPPPPPHVVRVDRRRKRGTKTAAKGKGGLWQFMAGRRPACRRRHADTDSDSDSDDDSVRAKTGWRRWLPRWLSRGRSKKSRAGYDTDSSSDSSTLAD